METKVTRYAVPSQLSRRFAMIGALLLIIGAFLPWGQVNDQIAKGLDGDGIITLFIGILVLILLFVRKVPLLISLILGLLAGVIGTVQTFSITEKIAEIKTMFASSLVGPAINGRIEIGVYITIIGAALIVFGTLIQWIKSHKK